MSKRDEMAKAYSERFSPGYWELFAKDKKWRAGCYERVDWFFGEIKNPAPDVKLEGARSIGKTMGVENHNERANDCWHAMLKLMQK